MTTRINRKKTLSVYPEITEIEYGSSIESADLNKQLKSIEESALRAILRGRELSSEMSRIQLGVLKSYLAMGKFIGALEYKNDSKLYATTYDVKTNRTASSDILYDTAYGYTTLNPIGSYTKIPRGEKYDGKVSPQVAVELQGVEVEPNAEIYDALDGTHKSFWLENVGTPDLRSIDIYVPPSLTKRFNYIEVHPFPLYGPKIESIQYMPFNNAILEDVTKGIYGGNPLSNNRGESVKLYLSPKEFNGRIRINVTPDDDQYIGFSNIDVKFLDFDNTSKDGFLIFNGFGQDNDYTINIEKVDIDWYFDGPESMVLSDSTPIKMWISVGTIADNVFTNDIRYPIDLADIRTLTMNEQVTVERDQELVLEFQLKEHNVTTPVIRGAKITYTEVP